MAERPRELGDFKGWVTLRLNFRLYFWRVTFRAHIYGPLDRVMVILEVTLEVFTQRNFVADFIRKFYSKQKQKNRFLSHPLGHLVVTYALHP